MKKVLVILFFVTFTVTSFSQSAFDKALKSISNDLAGKLKLQDRKKLVVLFITDINNATTTAGKYLADNVSFNLVNDTAFNVFERENLSNIEEVKELIKEGFINAEKSKEIGKLLSVNTIIIGSYTVLSNTIKLSLKALSSNNGATIAASMMDLPLNADAGALLGIKILAPGENASQDPNCKEKNTGDYCFKNTTSQDLDVRINNKLYTIKSNQTQCIYDIPVGSYNYSIIVTGGLVYTMNGWVGYSSSGQVYVEPCKSKTFIIK